jgi:hypothetical protein
MHHLLLKASICMATPWFFNCLAYQFLQLLGDFWLRLAVPSCSKACIALLQASLLFGWQQRTSSLASYQDLQQQGSELAGQKNSGKSIYSEGPTQTCKISVRWIIDLETTVSIILVDSREQAAWQLHSRRTKQMYIWL